MRNSTRIKVYRYGLGLADYKSSFLIPDTKADDIRNEITKYVHDQANESGMLFNDFEDRLELVIKTMDSFDVSNGWIWPESYVGVLPFPSNDGQFMDYYAIRKQDNNGELMMTTTTNLEGLLDECIFRECGFVEYKPSGEKVNSVESVHPNSIV